MRTRRHRLRGTLVPVILLGLAANPVHAQDFPRRFSDLRGTLEAIHGINFSQYARPGQAGSAPLILVTNTSDAGPGSLRQALIDANSNVGPDSIAFNIPTSDPGYSGLTGVWTIRPLSQLPLMTDDRTTIAGETQALFSPGSNPHGPAVELDGSLSGPLDCGLSIICSWTWVRSLAINRFSEMGIIIAGPGHSFNVISHCYIGVTPDGIGKAPNAKAGIQILDANLNLISWLDTTFANVIGGNGQAGIEIVGQGSDLNYIGPNCIGTNLSHTANVGNAGDGITIRDGATDNSITGFDFPKSIVIWNNAQAGIRVSGPTTVRNLLAAGSITRNGGPGILLENGGNGSMPSPNITDVTKDQILANALPNSLVLFFRDQQDEGEEYFGQAYADAVGAVTYSGPVQGPYVTALAVDTTTGTTKNNTSAFSDPFHFIQWITVTNTQDSGPGSLRDAINLANTHPGPDSIRFAVPTSDPGFTPLLGTWTIRPVNPLPSLGDAGTTVDGSSQNAFVGYDINPYGPEIELEGSLPGNDVGLYVSYSAHGAQIAGLIINRFPYSGIFVNAVDTAHIIGCFIGTDARGLQSAPNGDGIVLYNKARHVYIGRSQTLPGNLISGNTRHGILVWDTCHANRIVGNTIGLDRNGTKKLGNGYAGIIVQGLGGDIEISDNWIGGNQRGVEIVQGSHDCTIQENMIGTDAAGHLDLGNVLQGIYVGNSHGTVIMGNRIAFNGGSGVFINGSSALHNQISRNWISHHLAPGIVNVGGGNAEYPSPTITSLSGGVLAGTAQAYDLIEVFSDSVDEGEFFLGSTQADASGDWTIVQMAEPRGGYMTATAMDAKGNTSRFSAPFDYIAADVRTALEEIPETFSLSQNYPNPFNPMTVIESQLPTACDVRLAVVDLLGREVAVLVDEKRGPGTYEDSFDAGGLASGVYVYRLTAGQFAASKTMVCVK